MTERRPRAARDDSRARRRSRRGRRLRVLMLGWEYPPRIAGGLGTACRGLARGLGRCGADVTFLLPGAEDPREDGPVRVLGAGAFDPGGAGAAPEGDGDAPRPRAYSDGGRWPAARAAPTAGDVPPRFEDLPEDVLRYERAVEAFARGERFDLVHGHDWMTYPAAAAAAAALGVPLVLHVHSTERDRTGPRAHPGIVEVERRGLALADLVVCVSAFTADRVAREYGVERERVRVVHNAALHEPEPLPARRARHLPEPVVLFLGRVTFQKGPAFFLEAAALVARRHRAARFVVAGEGDLLPWMIERAAALGLSRRVHFTGFVAGEARERAFAAADVLVMPSVAEPFGIVALEAMARGVPVVLSRQSGAAEVVASVLRTDYWDVEDMARKILSVLRDPALRARLAAEGRAEAGRWRWERQAAVLRDAYDEVLP